MNIRNFRIGIRSTIAFGIMGSISLILGFFGILQMSSLNDEVDVMGEHRLPALIAISDMQKDFLLSRVETANLGYAKSAQERQVILARLEKVLAHYDDAEKRMLSLAKAPEARRILERIDKSMTKTKQLRKELVAMYDAGRTEEANIFREQGFLDEVAEITDALMDLSDFQQKRAEDTSNDAQTLYDTSTVMMIVVIICAVVATGVLAVVFSRSLIIPIGQAVEVAKTIASGDLSKGYSDDGKDEAADLIRSLSQMQDNLKSTIQAIADSSNQLAATSEELSQVTHSSSQHIRKQGQELEQAATAVNEMTAAIEEVASNTSYTSKESDNANKTAVTGTKKVQETIHTIDELVNELKSTMQGVDALAGRVKSIGSVLDVIRAIAEQTNLLALNAAIEAARAGESGRGFAVVADEVRALAHRTQESTKEIENMITLTQGDTEKTVSSMAQSNERASQTLAVANQAGEALQQIGDIISQINEQNLTIASAVEQQAQVAKEVDRNLVNIRDLAEQTSDGAEQSNIASAELAKLAENLNNMVHQFRLS
ncbi:methyl-accepting chemotaxis protein [Neptunicella marina]|uniref:Methyl-accepting chemotaxis protein n=1 Tax=Neptunicella marina TaxID=2125989 RepID=A0A8J6M3V5_9ALTE|nr:methyl-accepting chemotaxis protein [Neptunicella marina]MBC3765666.1 methyl-accepting chemotaxis protein [Neptunicella marina]